MRTTQTSTQLMMESTIVPTIYKELNLVKIPVSASCWVYTWMFVDEALVEE